MEDLKSIFTSEVQRQTKGFVYIQALNNNLECIVKTNNKKNSVIFIYNNNTSKKWEYSLKLFNESLYSHTICIFINDTKNNSKEYHIINFMKLVEISNISFNEILTNKTTSYYFEDFNNEYLDKWDLLQ